MPLAGWIAVPFSDFLLAGAAGITALVATAYIPVIARKGMRVLFDARLFVTGGILLFLVVGMLNSVFRLQAGQLFLQATLFKAIVVVASCALGLFLGGSLRAPTLKPGPLTSAELSNPRLLFFTLLLGVAGLFWTLTFASPFEEYDPTISGPERVPVHFLAVAGVLAVWLLLTYRPKTPARRLGLYLTLFPLAGVSILSGSRVPLAFVGGFAIIAWAYRGWCRRPERFTLPRVAVAGTVLLLGLVFALAVADVLTGERWRVEVSPAELAEEGMSRFATLDTFQNLALSIKLYPEQGRYLYGWSIAGAFLNPIPRSVWPLKPYGYGRLLVEESGRAHMRGLSWAPSLAGELVANFGYAAPFFGYFLLGFLANAFYAHFSRAKPFSGFVPLYLAGLMLFTLESRGDLQTINMRAGFYLLALYSVLRLSVPRSRSAKIRAQGLVWAPRPQEP